MKTKRINDNIYTEIIADGIHVSDDALKLLFRMKPKDKILLISDALPITYSNIKETYFADEKIYYDGGLYKNLGYGGAVKANYDKAIDITKNATEYGYSVKDTHNGLQYLTTPLCAIGGFVGGIGYFIGDSVADMFRKGKNVQINPGDVLEVRLINPIDIPVY